MSRLVDVSRSPLRAPGLAVAAWLCLALLGCGGEEVDDGSTPGSTLDADGGGADLTIRMMWDGAYCADVRIHNDGATARSWVLVMDTMDSRITSSWDVTLSGVEGEVTATPVALNARVERGGNVGFGFCADILGPERRPELVSLRFVRDGAGVPGEGGDGTGGPDGSGDGAEGQDGAQDPGDDAGAPSGPPVCTDVPPDDMYTCAQQAGWQKCDEPWMAGKCDESCGRCSQDDECGSAEECQSALYPELVGDHGAQMTCDRVAGALTCMCGAAPCRDLAPGTCDDGEKNQGESDVDCGGPCAACAPLCKPRFVSGANLAWKDFGRDVPNPDLDFFHGFLGDVKGQGGNTVRWWFHTNGSFTPSFDAGGAALPISDAEIDDVRSILDAARAEGVAVLISLWSFDMQQDQYRVNFENNRKILQSDEHRQAYIDHVLTPLVRALNAHPALHSWEIFNEPEGMTNEFGWSSRRVNMVDIQKTVNWLADAIHRAAPGAVVTNGSWSFRSNADVDGYTNYYRDDRLRQVGGRDQGTLDYYQVHYYDWGGTALSPFHNALSHWNLDKPVLVGEFYPDDTFGVASAQLFTKVYEGGYSGALAWDYTSKWEAMKAPMSELRSRHPDDVAYPGSDCP